MRGGTGQTLLPAFSPAVMGTRMRFPGYPSNREADERARMPLRARAEQGRFSLCSPACGKVRK